MQFKTMLEDILHRDIWFEAVGEKGREGIGEGGIKSLVVFPKRGSVAVANGDFGKRVKGVKLIIENAPKIGVFSIGIQIVITEILK